MSNASHPNAEHEDLRKRLGIPAGSHVQFIDMDANKEIPVITGGWSDEQIKAKPLAEIESMVQQRSTGLAQLVKTVDTERSEIEKLKLVLDRKRLIGD